MAVDSYRYELGVLRKVENCCSEQRATTTMKTTLESISAFILSFAILLPIPLFARASTDVIVMKNGDHLTGEIKGLNQGVLYISMKYILGTSSVQWSEVAHLESKQLFLVKTAGRLGVHRDT